MAEEEKTASELNVEPLKKKVLATDSIMSSSTTTTAKEQQDAKSEKIPQCIQDEQEAKDLNPESEVSKEIVDDDETESNIKEKTDSESSPKLVIDEEESLEDTSKSEIALLESVNIDEADAKKNSPDFIQIAGDVCEKPEKAESCEEIPQIDRMEHKATEEKPEVEVELSQVDEEKKTESADVIEIRDHVAGETEKSKLCEEENVESKSMVVETPKAEINEEKPTVEDEMSQTDEENKPYSTDVDEETEKSNLCEEDNPNSDAMEMETITIDTTEDKLMVVAELSQKNEVKTPFLADVIENRDNVGKETGKSKLCEEENPNSEPMEIETIISDTTKDKPVVKAELSQVDDEKKTFSSDVIEIHDDVEKTASADVDEETEKSKLCEEENPNSEPMEIETIISDTTKDKPVVKAELSQVDDEKKTFSSDVIEIHDDVEKTASADVDEETEKSKLCEEENPNSEPMEIETIISDTTKDKSVVKAQLSQVDEEKKTLSSDVIEIRGDVGKETEKTASADVDEETEKSKLCEEQNPNSEAMEIETITSDTTEDKPVVKAELSKLDEEKKTFSSDVIEIHDDVGKETVKSNICEEENPNSEAMEIENSESTEDMPVVEAKFAQPPASVDVIETADDVGETTEKAEFSEDRNSEMSDEKEKPITVIEIDDEEDECEKKIDKNIKETELSTNMAIDSPNPTLNGQTSETIDKDIEMKDTEVKESKTKDGDDDAKIPSDIKNMDETTSLESATLGTTADGNECEPEFYYNKECVNYECKSMHSHYFRAPEFVLSYFNVNNKKAKAMYVCDDCYEEAASKYNELANMLLTKQPLFSKNVKAKREECVEIIDSSDEDDTGEASGGRTTMQMPLSQFNIDLMANELQNSIISVFQKIDIQEQLTWSKTILERKIETITDDNEVIDFELAAMKHKADSISKGLYSCSKIKTRSLEPWDADLNRSFELGRFPNLPPFGDVYRPPIETNGKYYAVKTKVMASWVPCTVIDALDSSLSTQKDLKHFKIRFLQSQYQMYRTVSEKHMAYFDPPSMRLPIGERVLAYFDASLTSRGRQAQSAFYPGIIAEPLKPQNKYRYLIFFDDGYTQYVYQKDVRLVCNVSRLVWEDVHPGSRDFVRRYVTEYSTNRPMVQTQKGQSMRAETNGRWPMARVLEIDCSLIKMQFEGSRNHTEWIYRGSLRLGPVNKEYMNDEEKKGTPMTSRISYRTGPFVRYTADEEVSPLQRQQHQQQQQKAIAGPRAVAKKTTTRPSTMLPSGSATQTQRVRHLNNSTIYLDDDTQPKGKVVYYTAKRHLPPLPYKPHLCSPSCLYTITHNLSAYSPLAKPLLSGWERLIIRQKNKKIITYRAPCGKMMRNMKELRDYLRCTENVLNVDNFDFCEMTYCLAEYIIDGAIVQKRDISEGQEKMAVPLVNYYDSTMPPPCKYAAQRIPTEGVHINTDEEFLVGCDCEDDCMDKEKCACWQLTYESAESDSINRNISKDDIGYEYKRLYQPVLTGIYECNSRCKCKSNCLNRVVQHSLEMKLQVFKTSNRGWGLRCINDVPRGSFVCIYAGHLLTEAKANEGGIQAGDEYLAELDYIEVAEQIKEGYESEVQEDDFEEDDDDEFTPSKSFIKRNKQRQPQEESQERQMINFNPETNEFDDDNNKESSTRKLFGKDEAIYVMDAKVTGNLGRYFNHSCAPNLFVQNVFVDTHDLRFPWVAFFASQHIRAGTELTWNYNYEVGVVPGKVLYCQCGTPTCRIRLL